MGLVSLALSYILGCSPAHSLPLHFQPYFSLISQRVLILSSTGVLCAHATQSPFISLLLLFWLVSSHLSISSFLLVLLLRSLLLLLLECWPLVVSRVALHFCPFRVWDRCLSVLALLSVPISILSPPPSLCLASPYPLFILALFLSLFLPFLSPSGCSLLSSLPSLFLLIPFLSSNF